MLIFLLSTAIANTPITTTVRVVEAPRPTPHCGIFHFVALARVEAVSSTAGLPTEPFAIAISCPEMSPPLIAGETLCMTISDQDPGWPLGMIDTTGATSWWYALSITPTCAPR
ncbi:MAG: hypothetical protein AAFV53_42150 [Myxococcota bacterium]